MTTITNVLIRERGQETRTKKKLLENIRNFRWKKFTLFWGYDIFNVKFRSTLGSSPMSPRSLSGDLAFTFCQQPGIGNPSGPCSATGETRNITMTTETGREPIDNQQSMTINWKTEATRATPRGAFPKQNTLASGSFSSNDRFLCIINKQTNK